MVFLKYFQFMMLNIALLLPFTALAKSIPFSIPTKDKLTQIKGQIDLPETAKLKYFPLVLLVGGTHLFDRDYDFGNSNTDKDLLFLQLSKKLTAKGFAVARYDYRGIKCNKRTVNKCLTCKTHEEFMSYFVNSCIDNSIRSTVTVETTQDDIESVYNFAKSLPFVFPHKDIIIAHSEGTIHTATLVEKRKINPKAILFWGFVAESPQEIFKWQWMDRSLSNLLQTYGLKRGENLTNEAISLQCKKINLAEKQCQEIKSSKGFYTTDDLENQIKDQYEDLRIEALSHSDTESFKYVWSKYGAIFSSYKWWKRWFSDDKANINKLYGYSGKISFINGTIDMATPSTRELNIVKSNKINFKNTIRTNEVTGVGHGLGTNPANGPITEGSMNLILSEVDWLSR